MRRHSARHEHLHAGDPLSDGHQRVILCAGSVFQGVGLNRLSEIEEQPDQSRAMAA